MGRKPTMRVTRAWLRRRGACKEGLRLFSKIFPKGAEVTVENVIKAQRAGLDISWLAHNRMPAWMLHRWYAWRHRFQLIYNEQTRGVWIRDTKDKRYATLLKNRAESFVKAWTLTLEEPGVMPWE